MTVSVFNAISGFSAGNPLSAGNSLSAGFSISDHGTHHGGGSWSFSYSCGG